jgi:hypothetical protein
MAATNNNRREKERKRGMNEKGSEKVPPTAFSS